MSRTIVLTNDEVSEIEKRLGEIIAKVGPYKMDNFEHALSVMDNSANNAVVIRNLLVNKTVFIDEERVKLEGSP